MDLQLIKHLEYLEKTIKRKIEMEFSNLTLKIMVGFYIMTFILFMVIALSK